MEELRAQNAALKKENRGLARANAILFDAAAFWAVLERQERRQRSKLLIVITGRADLESVAGRPVIGPLGDVAPGLLPPPGRRHLQADCQAVLDANYRVYGRRKMKATLRREHGINLDKIGSDG